MSFELARKVADAVLYEGYVLYPYRRSSTKNQFRWQFGIVAPRPWSEAGGGDPWEMQTECLIEPLGDAAVEITVRFLQVRAAEGEWEDGIERTINLHGVRLDELTAAPREEAFAIEGAPPLSGRLRLSAEPVDGLIRLRIRIENLTEFAGAAEAERSAVRAAG